MERYLVVLIALMSLWLLLDEAGLEMPYKVSYTNTRPFLRLKVKIEEIVTLGQEGVDPNKQVGEYVGKDKWHELLDDKDVLVIDTRNDYEIESGTFPEAVSPNTTNFRDFPQYVSTLDKTKHKKVAMFCTGGIRCEKASSFMLKEGFETVYHKVVS